MDETNNTPTTPQPVPATPGASSHTKWIIIGVVVLAGLYVIQNIFLSPERIIERALESGTAGEYDVDVDRAGNVTYTGDDGESVSVAAGEDVKLPADWPDSLPVMSGAKITYAGTVNTTDNTTGLMVSYSVDRAPADMVTYYKEELVSNGWKIEAVSETPSATMLSATNEAGGSVAMYAVPEGTGTAITLTAELSK